MNKGKKRPCKRVVLPCPQKERMIDKALEEKTMIKLQKKLKAIKKINKGKKLGQLPPTI